MDGWAPGSELGFDELTAHPQRALAWQGHHENLDRRRARMGRGGVALTGSRPGGAFPWRRLRITRMCGRCTPFGGSAPHRAAQHDGQLMAPWEEAEITTFMRLEKFPNYIDTKVKKGVFLPEPARRLLGAVQRRIG